MTEMWGGVGRLRRFITGFWEVVPLGVATGG